MRSRSGWKPAVWRVTTRILIVPRRTGGWGADARRAARDLHAARGYGPPGRVGTRPRDQPAAPRHDGAESARELHDDLSQRLALLSVGNGAPRPEPPGGLPVPRAHAGAIGPSAAIVLV